MLLKGRKIRPLTYDNEVTMWDPYAEFESTILPNGLDVHVAHWHDRPWVALGFVVHSGALHDEVGLEGTAHYLEHLVSRNTIIPYQSIKTFFEQLGGQASLGETGYHHTAYHAFCTTKEADLAKAFEIFGSMLLSVRINEFIEVQKRIVLEEFQKKYALKYRFDIEKKIVKTLYGDHWRSRFLTPLGEPESINSITQADLQGFYDGHYTPQNISVVCVGGVSLESVYALLSCSPFAVSKPGLRSPVLSKAMTIDPPAENRYVFELSKIVGVKAESIGYGSTALIPMDSVKESAASIAGQMLNRVLFEEVREELGLTYDIHTERRYYQDVMEFSIVSEALKLHAADSIESIVDRCIDSLAKRQDLFDEILNRSLSRFNMLDITGSKLRNIAMEELEKHQRIETNAETIADYQSLTIDDVRAAISHLRSERRFTLLRVP